MGVHVILDIDPRGIAPAAWAAVYEETFALLSAWRPGLLGWGERSVDGVRVRMYARSIGGPPREPCWSVVGDRESLQTAERQALHRDLGHYARGLPRGADDDIVVAAAAPEREDTGGPARVFGDKTQGCPYHFAVLAAAMLVEERFPRHAMVWGDIDRGQAEEARRLAAPILGRALPLPVRVDADRLVERLQGAYGADALAGAFGRVYLEEAGDGLEAVLRAFPGEPGAELWRHALAGHASPGALGAVRLLIAWLNTGRELRDACRFACLAPDGPRFSPEALVDALVSTWIAIPRGVRAPFDVLHKPEGASHTVTSLLSGVFFDIGAMGRHLRVHGEPAALAADLAAVFGHQGARLTARLREKSAELSEQLRVLGDGVGALAEEGAAGGRDDLEALVTLRDPDAMGARQRTWVRWMAWSAMQTLASLRAGRRESVEVLGSAAEAKRVLARVLSERGPTLTEDAWDVVLAEEDPQILAWWIALASLDADELSASQVRRALLENAALRRYAIAIGHDAREMRELDEQVAQARAQTQTMKG